MLSQSFYRYWGVQFFLSFALVILTRLPCLLGDHFYFDGDEAIIGIMAQDLIEGKNLPVYFYGQQYGFSFFEVIAVAIGILFFGSTTWALKLGGIIVFSVGISFLFRLCVKKNLTLILSLSLVLIICCFPAWVLWSMKPRGGYLTAFACSCILLYVFQTQTTNIKTVIITSMILSIGVHAQILVTIPIGICFAWFLLKSRSFKITMIASIALVIFMILFKLPAFLNDAYWNVPLANKINLKNISHLVDRLPQLWIGSYFYELIFPVQKTLLIIAGVYFLLSIVILFIALFSRQKDFIGYLISLIIGGLISFFFISKISGGMYRYTLGLFTAFLLILVLAMIYGFAQRKALTQIVSAFLIAIGLIGVYQQKNIPALWMHPERNDQKMYNQLTDHLRRTGINHLFVLDPMLQWQLNYSGFPSRHTSKKERINRFVDQVNECYANPGCKVGLVGYTGYFKYSDSRNDWDSNITVVNERFFVYTRPEDRHLKAGGFE